jgi:hypothetical protein
LVPDRSDGEGGSIQNRLELQIGSHSQGSFAGLKMTQGGLVVVLLYRLLGFRGAGIFALRFGAVYPLGQILRSDEERSNRHCILRVRLWRQLAPC